MRTQLRHVVSKQESWVVWASIVLLLSSAHLSSRYALGWPAATVAAGSMFAFMTLYALIAHDSFFKHLLMFGLAAGWVELLADHWLVNGTKTLVYAVDEPMIWSSPAYMPFAWAVVITQIGYLGWLISSREKLWETIILSFFIGTAMIPLYEHWAHKANWWKYIDCRMLADTPYYIVIGEGIICSMLPLFYEKLAQTNRVFYFVMGGVLFGFWIWLAYYLSYVYLK